ncbi:CmcJ/NvfI family oxidoreductase [Paraburkholderia sp. RAU2J]|uniref:CmcJ/NvfI family oxidoreductase n=1 Tax=Paraburkholderia sp. RAU2J TaxID=1938810 RepID=UPI001F545C77|nr:CmcJ/NvfI family oxidoreductase [Paraburkholderia sp. RAU2J]
MSDIGIDAPASAAAIEAELNYLEFNGETYALVFNPRHRWYCFPHMTPDEFLLLKIYDCAGDSLARLSAHSAFDDPTSAADAPPRRSIELRSLLFF